MTQIIPSSLPGRSPGRPEDSAQIPVEAVPPGASSPTPFSKVNAAFNDMLQPSLRIISCA